MFLYIFGIFDYGQKRIGIVEEFELSDDARADLIRAKTIL